MKQDIEIGLLYSHSGSYRNLSLASRQGVMQAVEHINSDPTYSFRFRIVERDPGGNVDQYAPLAQEIFETSRARHIFGCTTSWSRKEVIPNLERYEGALWYSAPYEGFEASDYVAYMHACPNQHLIPLLKWAMPRFGGSAYLIGSNYIWGWEMSRLAREIIVENGGEVLNDRYLPIGDTDVDRMVQDIEATRPDFILNSLVGHSQYAFIEKLAKKGLVATCPVLSCNLTECEIGALGSNAEGLIAAGPYFKLSEDMPFANSFEEASNKAVYEYARFLKIHGVDAAYQPLKRLLANVPFDARELNPRNHHVTLPISIAMVYDQKFKILEQRGNVAGDPYLTNTPRGFLSDPARLRVVK